MSSSSHAWRWQRARTSTPLTKWRAANPSKNHGPPNKLVIGFVTFGNVRDWRAVTTSSWTRAITTTSRYDCSGRACECMRRDHLETDASPNWQERAAIRPARAVENLITNWSAHATCRYIERHRNIAAMPILLWLHHRYARIYYSERTLCCDLVF